MHHMLAGTPFKLTYLQDRRVSRMVDWAALHDDLMDAGTPLNYWRWCELDALTHIVLATNRVTGRYAGVLGLIIRAIAGESWLSIETSIVRPKDEDGMLPRAMLAHALTRVICFDGKPAAIVAPPGAATALPALAAEIGAMAMHPPAAGNVIALEAARLARRIGRGGILLDLRDAAESNLLRELRRLHGGRPNRTGRAIAVTAEPATPGDATRRPRTATHTGRIG